MKCAIGIILFLSVAAMAPAATSDPRDAQIQAAAGDAVERIRADIEAQPLGLEMNVGDFLKQTGGDEQLDQALRGADQIGGPRWIDNDTCQVKLSIDSQRVRDTLVKIARQSGRSSPLPPDAIAAKLRVWDDRSFTATGTSISAKRAQVIRPPDMRGPWRLAKKEACPKTIAAARDNAIDRILESVGSIEVSDAKNVSQVLTDESVRTGLHKWLVERPVTRIEFRSDLSIEITLAVEPRELFEAFSDAASKTDALPKDSVKLAKIRREFEQQMAAPVGSAQLSGAMMVNAAHAPRIPQQPPAWIDQSLTSEATARFKDSRLKTARAAEETARDALRKKVDALPLNATTIGETAQHDAAIERAVEGAVDRARAYKIDYLPDGSATVKISLDPRDLWDALDEVP